MSVSRATVRTPWASPRPTIVRASSRAASRSLHEGARADLHVEHQGVGALGDLLGHDRAGDQRDRLDRAGHVAQGVELAVGRGQVGARPRRSRRPPRRAGATNSSSRAGPCAARGSTRACRACRRCGRGRGRRAAAPRRRSAATSGQSGSETLSPTPPVECLSTVGAADAREVEALAGADHGLGPGGELARRQPAEEDGHAAAPRPARRRPRRRCRRR